MLKRIEIKNFKGIRNNVVIDFKPITLLFGPNSSGKSTIIQALHYAREIFERRNFNPTQVKTGGNAINLGGFKEIVNNHNLDNTISLKFDLDLKNIDLPGAQDISQHPRFKNLGELSRQIQSAWIKVEICWLKDLEIAEVVLYEVGINNVLLGQIKLDYKNPKNLTPFLSQCNLDHPLSEQFDFNKGDELKYFIIYLEEGIKSALPDFQSEKSFSFSFADNGSTNAGYTDSISIIENYEWVLSGYLDVIYSVGKLFIEELNKMIYIGPIREIPGRNFEPHFVDETARWANGLAAWDALYSGSQNIGYINKWMNILKTGYQIKLVEYKELPVEYLNNFQNEDQIAKLLTEMKNSVDTRLSDVDKIRFELESRTIKIFSEAKRRINERYTEILGPSQKLKDFIPTIIGSTIGMLGGPVGMVAGAMGDFIASYVRKSISKDEFETEVQKYLTNVFKEEEKKFLEIVREIEMVNSETENKLNILFNEFREEVQFRLMDTVENFRDEIKGLYSNLDKLKEELLPINESLSLLEYSKVLPLKKRIYLTDGEKNINIQPHDVGIGISQVVPVIIGALSRSKSILAVEQPELHIHPQMQVELADLFIEQINQNENTTFIIETHSEHLMLRLLRRIEETSQNKLKNESFRLSPAQIGVIYFEPNSEGLKLTNLPIDNSGEFERHWPRGFFEERAGELFPDE